MAGAFNEHYTDIASTFDYFYEPINQGKSPEIVNKLQLTPDDLLVDIGAATGQLANLLWKQASLKNPVTCVEPCEAFFEHATIKDGIVPVIQTAEQFCDNLVKDHVDDQKPFNKVLICGVCHHLDNIAKRLGQIFDYLPRNGICLIAQIPYDNLSLPLIKLHKREFEQSPQLSDVLIPYLKSRDDIITEVSTSESHFKITKGRWYYMIRNHFTSNLNKFTEKEIEEGIKELDDEKFKGVKDEDLITIVDKNVFVKATKK